MIMGYGIIAVPTGIVSAEYTSREKIKEIALLNVNTKACRNCNAVKHQDNAQYCHNCGNSLTHD